MKTNLIYDVGMNNGDDTAYYLHCGYPVVAIDANPMMVAQAEQRFAQQITAGLLTILNVGVAEASGHLPFWVCETYSEWSSFDRSIASREGCPHHEVMVPCRTFQSILEEFGSPYYLKVDIEGSEFMCLRDLGPETLPQYLSAETGGIELLARLRDLGYAKFKCISQFNFLPLEWPPSREQRHYELAQRLSRSRTVHWRLLRRLGARRWIDWQLSKIRSCRGWSFPWGSSGPFGKDLPGRWQCYEELSETYHRFQQMMKEGKPSVFWNDKEYSFWADFHACREGYSQP